MVAGEDVFLPEIGFMMLMMPVVVMPFVAMVRIRLAGRRKLLNACIHKFI
jgi:hypothetical protein